MFEYKSNQIRISQLKKISLLACHIRFAKHISNLPCNLTQHKSTRIRVNKWLSLCLCVCVRARVCACERERERVMERGKITFQFIKTARLVRAKLAPSITLLMLSIKVLTYTLNRVSPSSDGNDLSSSIKNFSDGVVERAGTKPFKANVHAS